MPVAMRLTARSDFASCGDYVSCEVPAQITNQVPTGDDADSLSAASLVLAHRVDRVRRRQPAPWWEYGGPA